MPGLSDLFDGMHGVIFPFAGTVAPGGFLMCDGSAVSRANYPALFAVVGTAFGAGDGSTTFNVPDLRGRVAAGKDNMGGSAAGRLTTGGSGINGASLGAAGGAETHTLTTPQIPSHAHGITPASYGAAQTVSQTGVNYNVTSVAGAFTSNAGGGGAHNNTQPTLILNHIIKT